MAKIVLHSFIKSVSGRIGNMFFRTYPSGTVTMTTTAPRKRATPPSAAEKEAQVLFAKRAEMVRKLAQEYPGKSRKELWKLVKQMDL